MVPNWISNAAGGKLKGPFLSGGNRDVPWPIASSVPRESQAGILKTAFWSPLLSMISNHFAHIYTAVETSKGRQELAYMDLQIQHIP